MAINWKELSDTQLFLILASLEEAEIYKSSRVFESTKTMCFNMLNEAEKEYNERKLNWEMFEGEE